MVKQGLELLGDPGGRTLIVPDVGDWRTVRHQVWKNYFSAILKARITYHQVFNPRFATAWSRYLNAMRPLWVGAGYAGSPAAHLRSHFGESFHAYAGTSDEHPAITALVRPIPDLTDPRLISLLLSDETEDDVAGVQKFPDQGQRLRALHPDAPEVVLSSRARRTLLAQIWNVPQTELLAESRRRGSGSVEHGLTLMRPFLIGRLRHTGRRGEKAEATS